VVLGRLPSHGIREQLIAANAPQKEPIIDIATYECFVERRAKNGTYPADHLEYGYMTGELR
jgi:hypothetical protein